MASRPAFELDTKTIGALPLVNHFLGRLRLEHFLRKHLSPPDPRSKLPPLSALGVIVRNLVLARMPIYSVQEWVKDRVPALLEFAKLAAPATYQRTASIHRARRRIAVRPPPGPAGLERHGNPNVLTLDKGTSRLAQGPSAHTTLVELEPVDGPIPEVKAFDAPTNLPD